MRTASNRPPRPFRPFPLLGTRGLVLMLELMAGEGAVGFGCVAYENLISGRHLQLQHEKRREKWGNQMGPSCSL